MRRSDVLLAGLATAMLLASVVVAAGSAKPAMAALPGENGRIAFCTDEARTLYSVLPDGSDYSYEVPFSTEYTCDPAYSPDGAKLAFSSDQDGDADIYVKNLTSGEVTQLTNEEEGFENWDSFPAWSPDGKKILFSSEDDLWVMDADGTDETPITETVDTGELRGEWSPRGDKIAFFRENDIWVMDADGSDAKNLTRTPNRGDDFASWSPSGRWIAWAKQSGPDASTDVWKMRADGTRKVRLSYFAGYDGDPACSPDGKKIAFIRDGLNFETDVWKMNASDGSNKKNVTKTEWKELHPDWQPKPVP